MKTERKKKTNLKLPSSCRATRQAVVFTAKKEKRKKQTEKEKAEHYLFSQEP